MSTAAPTRIRRKRPRVPARTAALIIEGRIRIPADVYTLDKFRAWAHSDEFPETGKVSYIAGEIEVDMSPEEIGSHLRLKTDLVIDLGNFAREHDLGEVLTDGGLLVNEEADISNEPDLMFCSWESLQSGRVSYRPANAGSERLVEVFGTPDLVVEIVSNSSVGKDTKRLRAAYFDASIPEYWLIDARRGKLQFDILVRGKSKYNVVTPDDDGCRHSRLFNRRFRLVRKLNRVGGACYELEIRSA
jgi:Uma2 family endonuclease